jgi:choline dehydrogenase-like flavoprotein
VPIDGCYLRWEPDRATVIGMCPLDIVGLDPRSGGLLVGLMVPTSRGRLSIRSPEARTEPELGFQMLRDERDRDRMRQAIRHAAKILDHPAIASIAAGLPTIPLDSDQELDQWLIANCGPFTHAAGTCRMGDESDPRSVVDTSCRVIGVEGLRVADASILPSLSSAPPHLTVVMIAEHLARLLLSPETPPTPTR